MNIAVIVYILTVSSHNIVSAALLRSLNKSANAIQFVFLGEGEYVDVDQTLAGMTLAVSQINSNSSILQDVTIELVSYSMPMGTTSPAATFEFGYLLCQSKKPLLMGSDTYSQTLQILLMACPEAISFSALAGGDLLSNKELYPRFWRYVTPWGSTLRAQAVHYVYFGWTSIGMVSSQNFEYLGALCKQYFPDHGVNIDAWTVFPEYDPNVSLLYYPQIQTEFKFLKYTNLRVFLAHVDGTQIMDVMMAANQTGLCGPEYVWTTSQSDLSVEPGSEHRWDTPLYPDLLRGVSIVNNPVGPSVNSTYLKEFMPDFLKFANSTAANNTDMYMFMDATEIDPTSQAYPLSYLFSNPGKDTIPANPVCSGYDGAWTLAHVCEKAIVNSGMTGAELANNSLSSTISLDLILSQAMAYSSLTEFSLFSRQGDPITDSFIMYQLTGLDYYSKVQVGVFHMNTATGSSGRPYLDVPSDSPPIYQDYVSPTDISTIIVLVCSAISTLYCLASFILLVKYGHSFQLMLGCAIGLSILPLNSFTLVGREKSNQCEFREYPIPVGITIILSCMLVKNMMLLSIFSLSANRIACFIRSIGSKWMFVPVMIITFPVLVIVSIVTLKYPLRSQEVYIEAIAGYNWTCVVSRPETMPLIYTAYTIILALCSVNIVLAYLNRDIPYRFNDSKEMATVITLTFVFGGLRISQRDSMTSVTTQFYSEAAAVIFGTLLLHTQIIWNTQHKFLKEIMRNNITGEKKNSILFSILSLKYNQTNWVSQSMFKKNDKKKKGQNGSNSYTKPTISIRHYGSSLINDASNPNQASYILIRAYILKKNLFSQWRLAQIAIIPNPVFVIRYCFDDDLNASID
ncbi:hypothetical protein BASA61_010390 [Batrachochytrium salamandrivorans]|nr:hypothetical protein BASA61_010390 [Batrachochytrium salamandrivorans]